jgi:release factor glutamine methyltransferase
MQSAIATLRAQLTPLYPTGEVNAIIRLLLEEVCDLTRTQQLAHPDLQLPDEQRQRLADIGRRLATGEPVQQALGYEWFMGRKFVVTRDTLIPRPETAELVELILGDVHNTHQTPPTHEVIHKSYPQILDIGTGTGCIAISLAAELPKAQVVGLDISESALRVAQRNAEQLKVTNVRFAQGDILRMAAGDLSTSYQQLWKNGDTPQPLDLIVSNPPYIQQSEQADMEQHVLRFEPHTALFVPDDDPLLFYRTIARFGCEHLRPGGRLYFEINAAFGRETCEMLSRAGYVEVRLLQDSFGRDRMISCRRG